MKKLTKTPAAKVAKKKISLKTKTTVQAKSKKFASGKKETSKTAQRGNLGNVEKTQSVRMSANPTPNQNPAHSPGHRRINLKTA